MWGATIFIASLKGFGSLMKWGCEKAIRATDVALSLTSGTLQDAEGAIDVSTDRAKSLLKHSHSKGNKGSESKDAEMTQQSELLTTSTKRNVSVELHEQKSRFQHKGTHSDRKKEKHAKREELGVEHQERLAFENVQQINAQLKAAFNRRKELLSQLQSVDIEEHELAEKLRETEFVREEYWLEHRFNELLPQFETKLDSVNNKVTQLQNKLDENTSQLEIFNQIVQFQSKVESTERAQFRETIQTALFDISKQQENLHQKFLVESNERLDAINAKSTKLEEEWIQRERDFRSDVQTTTSLQELALMELMHEIRSHKNVHRLAGEQFHADLLKLETRFVELFERLVLLSNQQTTFRSETNQLFGNHGSHLTQIQRSLNEHSQVKTHMEEQLITAVENSELKQIHEFEKHLREEMKHQEATHELLRGEISRQHKMQNDQRQELLHVIKKLELDQAHLLRELQQQFVDVESKHRLWQSTLEVRFDQLRRMELETQKMAEKPTIQVTEVNITSSPLEFEVIGFGEPLIGQ